MFSQLIIFFATVNIIGWLCLSFWQLRFFSWRLWLWNSAIMLRQRFQKIIRLLLRRFMLFLIFFIRQDTFRLFCILCSFFLLLFLQLRLFLKSDLFLFFLEGFGFLFLLFLELCIPLRLCLLFSCLFNAYKLLLILWLTLVRGLIQLIVLQLLFFLLSLLWTRLHFFLTFLQFFKFQFQFLLFLL